MTIDYHPSRPTRPPAVDQHRLTDEQKADLIRRADLGEAVYINGKHIVGGHLVRQSLGVLDTIAARRAELDAHVAKVAEQRNEALERLGPLIALLEDALAAEREARDAFVAAVESWTDVHTAYRTWISALETCVTRQLGVGDASRAARQDSDLLRAKGYEIEGPPATPHLPPHAQRPPTFSEALDIADGRPAPAA